MRVSGFEDLVLVAPHPLADPSHEQAIKLAVGSSDLLAKARVLSCLDEVKREGNLCVATSARRGVSGILSPRELASHLLARAQKGERAALLFGGERTGLRKTEVDGCDVVCRIPMVGNEPSLNLAQAVTVVLYELLVAALD
jgi:TrmH family RNA methyltransferase